MMARRNWIVWRATSIMPGLPNQKSSFWGCSDDAKRKTGGVIKKQPENMQVMLQNNEGKHFCWSVCL